MELNEYEIELIYYALEDYVHSDLFSCTVWLEVKENREDYVNMIKVLNRFRTLIYKES